jgi:hypothetical protein
MILDAKHDLLLADAQPLSRIHHHKIVRNHRPRLERRSPDPLQIANFIRAAAQRLIFPLGPIALEIFSLMTRPCGRATSTEWFAKVPVGENAPVN